MFPNQKGLIGDAWTRVVIPGCCADCQQGRRPCKCPEACQLPEPEEQDRRLRAVFWRLYAAFLMVAGCGFVAWLLPLFE